MEIRWRKPNKRGYIEGIVNGRCVKQHRWKMEQKLGRKLRPDEVVHHRNGDRADNRLRNLQLMTDSEHKSHHFFDHPNRRKATGDYRPLHRWVKKNGGSRLGTAEMWDLTCRNCDKTFRRSARQVRKERKKGSSNSFCGRHCASLYWAKIRP